MKGDIVVLATGRDSNLRVELLPTEAEARRRVKAWAKIKQHAGHEHTLSRPDMVATVDDTCAYYLFEPETLRRRGKKNVLLTTKLRAEILPTFLGLVDSVDHPESHAPGAKLCNP